MNVTDAFQFAVSNALTTLSQLWPLLLASALISVLLQVWVDPQRAARFLRRNERNSVLMSTATAVATPFCSCGTTAVVLGMMASTMPWAPIVAFLVASPLTSPQQLIYSAGLFGWPFALTFLLASILLGLTGGALAAVAERRGWLVNQARLKPQVSAPIAIVEMTEAMAADGPGSGAQANVQAPAQPRLTIGQFAREFVTLGGKLLLLFVSFAFIGYFLNGLIPQSWITSAFGSGRAWGVPLAALLGVPFYFNTEASMPVVRAFMDAGMSAGAALAFLITGAGTSIGALTGALTIARWRVIGLVLATLIGGAMIVGLVADLILLA